jgi:metal-sulfur cluster biosynthetic enzyme
MNTTDSSVVPTLEQVRAACASVYDPEFGVSIDDLGLIYDVALAGGAASVVMTLTTPSCPASDVIVDGVRAAVSAVPGIASVDVQLVWDPQWTPEMVNARGRDQLGWREA